MGLEKVASGLDIHFKKKLGDQASRCTKLGRDALKNAGPDAQPVTMSIKSQRRMKTAKTDTKAPNENTGDTRTCEKHVKINRRLQSWKLHAERLGSEAPRPRGGPQLEKQVKLTNKQRREAILKRHEERVAKRALEEVATPAKSSRKDGGDKKASEQAARESLEAGDVSLQAVQRALEKLDLPASSNRKNVIPRGVNEVRGLLFGLYCYGGTFGVTSATNEHPFLNKLLVSALRAVDASFPFTSIQLNHNYASRPHVDKNNLGCSYIVGFGNYEGGELWMHDDDAGEDAVKHTLDPEDEDISAQYLAGSTVLGRVEDIKERWSQFDGNKLHFTLPFTGNRYSVIYFTSDRYAGVPEEVKSNIQAAGFDFNWESNEVEETLQMKLADRQRFRQQRARERAEEAFHERLKRGRCIARIWADGWGHQCTAVCTDGEEMCNTHIKGHRWKTHGRFDGDLPPAKKDEMKRTQQKWIKQGKLPPPDEPWTKLVELP